MSAHRAAPTQPLSGNEWRVLPMLAPYLWEYRGRVAAALAFLAAAKLANVAVPLVMKEVVDGLDVERAVLVVPAALLAITNQMPAGFVVSVLFLVLTTVFVATTGDSMTYVLSVAMSNNDHPTTPVRVFWGVAMGLMALM